MANGKVDPRWPVPIIPDRGDNPNLPLNPERDEPGELDLQEIAERKRRELEEEESE